jgi:hypothetical protein
MKYVKKLSEMSIDELQALIVSKIDMVSIGAQFSSAFLLQEFKAQVDDETLNKLKIWIIDSFINKDNHIEVPMVSYLGFVGSPQEPEYRLIKRSRLEDNAVIPREFVDECRRIWASYAYGICNSTYFIEEKRFHFEAKYIGSWVVIDGLIIGTCSNHRDLAQCLYHYLYGDAELPEFVSSDFESSFIMDYAPLLDQYHPYCDDVPYMNLCDLYSDLIRSFSGDVVDYINDFIFICSASSVAMAENLFAYVPFYKYLSGKTKWLTYGSQYITAGCWSDNEKVVPLATRLR